MKSFLSTRAAIIIGMMLMSLMPLRSSCLRAAAPFVSSRLLATISSAGSGNRRSFASTRTSQFAARSALEEVSKKGYDIFCFGCSLVAAFFLSLTELLFHVFINISYREFTRKDAAWRNWISQGLYKHWSSLIGRCFDMFSQLRFF